MTSPRLSVILGLRLRLVLARCVALPPWQIALFLLALLASVGGSGMLLPVAVPMFRDLDEGLLVGTTLLMAGLTTVFGLHLLVVEGVDGSIARRQVDPWDLLPVPPQWAFLGQSLEEACLDPAATMILAPTLIGLALSSRNPLASLIVTVILGPLVLLTVAGLRVLGDRGSRSLLAPHRVRRLVRLITYAVLLITIVVGGVCVFDLVTWLRHNSLEPVSLVSTRLALPAFSWVQDHPLLARAFPPTWIVLSLTGGPGWVLWALLSLLFFGLGLSTMAALYSRLVRALGVPESGPTLPSSASRLGRALATWIPVAPPELIALESDLAAGRGLLSEATLEGVLVLGSLILLMTLVPGLYGRTYHDCFRFVVGLSTLVLTTPGAVLARETSGIGLRMSLPHSTSTLLLSKVPVVVLANLLVLLPAALGMPFLRPPPDFTMVIASGVLLAIIALVGALGAVGAGVVTAPLDGSATGFGRQVLALALTGLAVAPLTAVCVIGRPYPGAVGVMLSALMVTGLWQLAVARLENLASPPVDRMPDTLVGDTAVGAILYVVGGTTVASWAHRVLPFLDRDASLLVANVVVQLLVVRYCVLYLSYRRREVGDDLIWRAPPRHLGMALVVGCALGVVALVYGWFISEVLGIDVPEAAGGIGRFIRQGDRFPVLALLTVVSGAVLAPVAEELLFRSLLFRGLWRLLGGAGSAVLISALFFAVVHPPPGFPVIMLVGIVLAQTMVWSGRLWTCVVLHMAFNGVQLLAMATLGRAP